MPRSWAYDKEHALEKFYDSDEGFDAFRIATVPESGSARRMNWNKV